MQMNIASFFFQENKNKIKWKSFDSNDKEKEECHL
jgi:hypothetical protein